MTPAGYTLAEVFLASVSEDGTLSTLYETPADTNVELWTAFLGALETKNHGLAAYVNSKAAVTEFGTGAPELMRQALKLRGLAVDESVASTSTRFADAFPSKKKPQRDVGVNARFVYP